MRSFTTLGLAALVAAAGMTGAQAQTYTATGSVSPNKNGEGTFPSNGVTAESASNPTDAGFGSFGVLDFTGTRALAANTNLTGFTLTLTSFSGKFAQSGPLDIFLTSNTTPLTGSEGYTYQGDSATDGIGTQLGTLTALGSQTYTAVPKPATGTATAPASFTLTLNSAAQAVLASDLKAGDVKFVFGAPTGSTTSTALDGPGFTNSPAPTLSLNTSAPVPEASTTASFGLLLALGLGGIVVARRRKQA